MHNKLVHSLGVFTFVFFAMPLLILMGCGGGGSSNKETSRISQLVGKVYSKVIGDKIGVIKANIISLSDTLAEIQGTFEVDGETYNFKAPVDANGEFHAGFMRNVDGSNTIYGRGDIYGTIVQNSSSAPEPLSAIGTWQGNLPTPGGTPGQTTRYSGNLSLSNSIANTGSNSPGGTTAACQYKKSGSAGPLVSVASKNEIPSACSAGHLSTFGWSSLSPSDACNAAQDLRENEDLNFYNAKNASACYCITNGTGKVNGLPVPNLCFVFFDSGA